MPPPNPPPNPPSPSAAALQAAAASLQAAANSLNSVTRSLAARGGGGGGGGGGTAGFLPAAARAIQSGQGLSGILGAGLAGGVSGVQTMGGVTGGLVMFGRAIVGTIKELNELSKTQIDYNRNLSQASAAMSAVFAERDVRELLRDMEKGQRLAESARGLTRAEQGKEDNTKEIEILWERTKTNVATGWENFKATIFRPLNEMAAKVNRVVENTDPRGKVEEILMGEWVQAVAEEDRRKREEPVRELPADRSEARVR